MEEVQIPYGGGSDDCIANQEKTYYSEIYSGQDQHSATENAPRFKATHQRRSSGRSEERSASSGSSAHRKPRSSKECERNRSTVPAWRTGGPKEGEAGYCSAILEERNEENLNESTRSTHTSHSNSESISRIVQWALIIASSVHTSIMCI